MIVESLRVVRRPRWLALIVLSVLAASFAAVWLGLQQEARHTATTYVFGRRVGYLDTPPPVLDDHLNDLVNAVEFPAVFLAIEDRTLLRADRDYDFTIERLNDSQSVVQIIVRADRAGDAERIARILGEEVVNFVLRGQDASLLGEIGDIDVEIIEIERQQDELRAKAIGVAPPLAVSRIEQQIDALNQLSDSDPTVEQVLRDLLTVIQPLSGDYQRNAIELNRLYRDRAQRETARADLIASIEGINDDWYRSITPVEEASNVPLAVAMAFAAAVPTALVSVALVTLNLNRRLTGRILPRRRADPPVE